MVLAQKDIDDVKDTVSNFKIKQEAINEKNVEMFANINTNLEWVKSFLKTNLK